MNRPVRRVLSSLNFLMVALLLAVLFIMVNYLASRRYVRWDLTQTKITALSGQTIQTLKSLEQPVAVTVFYQPGQRLHELIKDLLTEYQQVAPKLSVEYVDPEQDVARAKQMVQQLNIKEANVVVFQSGPRHKHVSDPELAEFDYTTAATTGQPRVKSFKGEEAFTSAILSVTQATQPLIWFTDGHGEKSLEDQAPVGLSDLKRYLEQQNMAVKPVTLLQQTSVPADVKLIVIAGPVRRFTEPEVALLQQFLDGGGRVLALIDPLDDTGLDGLLERWGLRLDLDIVVDPARQLPFVSPANLFVTTYTQHPIVQKMKTLMTLFPLARSIRPVEPAPAGLTVSALAMTSEEGWGERKTAEEEFSFAKGEDLPGPVPIAAASERVSGSAKSRLVVVGDSEFVANSQLGNVGNRDLLLGTALWLLEQEQLIGISPKPLESLKLRITSAQLRQIFWLSFLIMPLCFGLLGVLVWWVRRT